jgi:hypothetical protein
MLPDRKAKSDLASKWEVAMSGNLTGKWVGNDPEGIGTADLSHEGSRITGHGTGGSVHPTLTSKFDLHEGDERHYRGTYTNQEGVAAGSGKMEIKVLDHRTIEMSWDGDWSGGGSGGRTKGQTVMHREH